MKKWFFLAALAALSSCLKLDGNLFNSTKITSYQLEDYEKDPFLRVDSSYNISSDKIHLFTLESDTAGSKAKIYALYIGDTARIATDTVFMYCHGNAQHMDLYWQRAKALANTGWKHRYGVLMLDYRSYGMSEGTSSEATLYADVNAGIKWLKDHGLTSNRMIMYGFSLGTAPATELSVHPKWLTPSKLILEAPFASTDEMAQDGSGLTLPVDFFGTAKLDNAGKIGSFNAPFMWIHGYADDYLSYYTHGQVVWEHYKGPKGVKLSVVGGGHGNTPFVYGIKSYLEKVQSFIEN